MKTESEVSTKTLKKSLTARHLSMISLGGVIGTGLFLASGSTIAGAGPAGALISYILIGGMVYFLMTSLGEMSTHRPDSGSFSTYSTDYVEKSFGFATGWNYWYNWAITLAFELAAAGMIMKFWFPDVPMFIWSAIFLVVVAVVNGFSVKGFGETEFFLASIKVFAVVIFIIFGVALIVGLPIGSGSGISNYFPINDPFKNGFGGIVSVFIIAGFAFQGTEFVGVAAGESKDPKKDVPKAIKTVFWRILIFYVLTIFIIGALIPSDDPTLTVEDVALSPFTHVFSQIGIPGAASVINFIILTAVLSAGNSGTYVSTRTLYALAKQGDAPKFLTKLTNKGVPIFALLATLFVGALTLLSSLFGDGLVYTWLLNLSALSGFLSWVSIAISHYRFRKGYLAQKGNLDGLVYTAKLFPFGPILALCACIFIIFGQNYEMFFGGDINWTSVLSTYISVPIFLGLYLVHKFITKSKIVKYKEMVL